MHLPQESYQIPALYAHHSPELHNTASNHTVYWIRRPESPIRSNSTYKTAKKQVPRLFLGAFVLYLPQQSCHWPVVGAQHSPELISPASDHSSPNLTSRIANSIEFDLWNRWKNWFHDFFECVSAAYTPSNPTSYQQCVPNTLQHLLALHTPCLIISRIRRWIVTNSLPLKYIEKTVLTCFLGWFSHAPTPGIIQGTSSVCPAHSSTS